MCVVGFQDWFAVKLQTWTSSINCLLNVLFFCSQYSVVQRLNIEQIRAWESHKGSELTCYIVTRWNVFTGKCSLNFVLHLVRKHTLKACFVCLKSFARKNRLETFVHCQYSLCVQSKKAQRNCVKESERQKTTKSMTMPKFSLFSFFPDMLEWIQVWKRTILFVVAHFHFFVLWSQMNISHTQTFGH